MFDFHLTLTYLIKEQFDLVPDLQCSLHVTNVEHVATTHLHVLHLELHILIKQETLSGK